MTTTEEEQGARRLWIESLAKTLQFDRVAKVIGSKLGSDDNTEWENYGPYLLLWTVLFLEGPVLYSVEYVIKGPPHPLLVNPFWLLIPPGMTFVLWAALRLRRTYEGEIDDLRKRDTQETNYKPYVPQKLKFGLFGLLFVFNISYLLFTSRGQATVAIQGPEIALFRAVAIPTFYFLFIVDLVSLLIEIHLRLPRWIRKADVRLEPFKARDKAGMRPAGKLIARSSETYFFGIAFYSVFTTLPLLWHPDVSETAMEAYYSIDPITFLYLTAAWVLGIFIFVFSIWLISLHMRQRKDILINDIYDKIEDTNPGELSIERRQGDEDEEISVNWPHEECEEPDEIMNYTTLYVTQDRAEKIPEYPISTGALGEFAIVAIVPFLINIVTYFVTSGLL